MPPSRYSVACRRKSGKRYPKQVGIYAALHDGDWPKTDAPDDLTAQYYWKFSAYVGLMPQSMVSRTHVGCHQFRLTMYHRKPGKLNTQKMRDRMVYEVSLLSNA